MVNWTPPAERQRRLYSLNPIALLGALRRQPPSFWLVSIYLLFEYVRPQQIYEAINGPPYTLAAILLALVAFLLERRRLRYRAPDLLLTVFSMVVLASSYAAYNPSVSFSYEAMSGYFSWVLIYLLIANAVDSEERFLIFSLCFLLYSFKMSQHATRSWAANGFAFRNWGVTGGPAWFHNSGEFGIQMCVFLPLAVSFIRGLKKEWPPWARVCAWAMMGTAVTGIVASSSRGAVIGLGAVLLWMVMRNPHKIRGVFFTAVLCGLVVLILPDKSKARFATAGEDRTSLDRTTNWHQGITMIKENPVLGIGYANWRTYHMTHYGNQLLSHNIFIEAASELGLTGFAAFLSLIGCTFALNYRTRRIVRDYPRKGYFISEMANGLDGALIGFLASGFFVTVLYYPFFWINFAMTVGLNNAAIRATARDFREPAFAPAPTPVQTDSRSSRAL